MRVFATVIANGFSSEVQVAARLFAVTPGLAARVIVHGDASSKATALRFEELSRADVEAVDTGYRPNNLGQRSRPAKAASWAKFIATWPKLIASARAFRPDLVYSSQQRWDCVAASVVASALGIPQAVHLHYPPSRWLGRVAQRRLRTAARVITVSNFIRDLVIAHGTPAHRAFAVLNAVPLAPAASNEARALVRRELGLPEDGCVVGMVARLAPNKGQREAISAFARARKEDARFVLVGDGPDRALLERFVRDEGLESQVLFAGERRDVDALLGAFDIFLHPSYQDPCPLAVLEAQAAALPVVAFADGGIPEIVDDTGSGLLASTGDVAMLSTKLAELINDRERARALGRAGAARMAKYFSPLRAGAEFQRALADFDSPSR